MKNYFSKNLERRKYVITQTATQTILTFHAQSKSQGIFNCKRKSSKFSGPKSSYTTPTIPKILTKIAAIIFTNRKKFLIKSFILKYTFHFHHFGIYFLHIQRTPVIIPNPIIECMLLPKMFLQIVCFLEKIRNIT